MVTHGNPFSWITSHADRTEHAVSHDAEAASRALGRGVYEALCGERLLSASMDVGPAGRCSVCAAFATRLCFRRPAPRHAGRHRALPRKRSTTRSDMSIRQELAHRTVRTEEA